METRSRSKAKRYKPKALSNFSNKKRKQRSKCKKLEHERFDPLSIEHEQLDPLSIEHNQLDPLSIEHNQLDPLSIEHNQLDPFTIEHNQFGPLSIKPDLFDPISMEHDQFDHFTIEHNQLDPLSIEHNQFGPLSIKPDLFDPVSIEHNQFDPLSMSDPIINIKDEVVDVPDFQSKMVSNQQEEIDPSILIDDIKVEISESLLHVDFIPNSMGQNKYTDIKLNMEPRVMLIDLMLPVKEEFDGDITETPLVENNNTISKENSETVNKITGNLFDNIVFFSNYNFRANEQAHENLKTINNICCIHNSDPNSEEPLDNPLDISAGPNEDNVISKVQINNVVSVIEESTASTANLEKINEGVIEESTASTANLEKINEGVLDSNATTSSHSDINEETSNYDTDEDFNLLNDPFRLSELYTNDTVFIPTDMINKFICAPLDPLQRDEITQIIARHCSDQLKSVLESALKYKKHWGRKRLTGNDFRNGLILSGVDDVTNMSTLPATQLKRKIKPINFRDGSKRQKVAPNSSITLVSSWLGKLNPFSTEFSFLPCRLRSYFKVTINALISSQEELCLMALQDLKVNKNILTLVPHFIFYIKTEVLNQNYDFSRLCVFLQTLQSLFLNPYISFGQESNFSAVVYLLLKFLLDPSSHCNFTMDSWSLKDTIAQLLSQVLKRSGSRKLWFEVMFVLEATLCDKKRPLVCHYGVLVALNFIGVPAIEVALLPHIEEYFEHLNSVDYGMQYDTFRIRSPLIQLYYLLVSHFIKSQTEKSDVFPKKSQYIPRILKKLEVSEIQKAPFSEYFGDSLVLCFPLLNFVSCNVSGRVNKHSISVKNNIQNKIKHWKSCNASTKRKENSKIKGPFFDHQLIKRKVIKFGEIKMISC